METVGEENFQTVLFVYIREKKKLLCFYSCVMNRSIFLTSNILCVEWND